LSNTSEQIRFLVERCNKGDRRAWDEFYGKYLGLVSVAVRKHYLRGSQDAEDTIQEVFIGLFKALKQYDPARSIEAYILEIVRRVRISRYRQVSALKRGGNNPGPGSLQPHDNLGEGGYFAVASHEEDPEMSLIKAQERRLLRAALENLDEKCRELLGLRYDGGYSYKEIADLLGAKEVTLRSQVQRCLSALGQSYSRLDRPEVDRP
jgi:RNA polymerase sigma-70 factor, ECF subfamily